MVKTGEIEEPSVGYANTPGKPQLENQYGGYNSKQQHGHGAWLPTFSSLAAFQPILFSFLRKLSSPFCASLSIHLTHIYIIDLNIYIYIYGYTELLSFFLHCFYIFFFFPKYTVTCLSDKKKC